MASSMKWQNGKTATFKADGKTLEGVCYGPAPFDAPTIVLLHEGLGCLELWRDFPQNLAKQTGCGVFAYSRAGYGKSDPAELPRPVDYMTHEALSVLPDVLDVIGFERGVLLGHSDGASIATIYAGGVEDLRIRGLALIAPHFFTEPMGLAAIKQTKKTYQTGDLREKLAKYHTHVDNAFSGWNDAWLNPEFEDWNIGDAIDYLRIPVLGIQGEDDAYGTMVQIDELENRLYSPFDKEILKNCGHSPHVEKPDETLAIVVEFIKRLNRIENADVSLEVKVA